MNKRKAKDISIRAAKTFLQAFLSAISVGAVMSEDRTAAKATLIAALAAGFSALINFTLALLKDDYL